MRTPQGIGSCWTGVFAGRRAGPSIIAALNRGQCFGSEASLVDFSCNGRPMGSVLRVGKGQPLDFAFRVADSAGVAWIRIVSQGRVVKEVWTRNQRVVDGTWKCKAAARGRYFRLETAASDDRRAFSTPIYVQPT